MSAALRFRRRASDAAPSGKRESAPSSMAESVPLQENSATAERQEGLALASIQSCYRNAFYSTAVDVFLVVSQSPLFAATTRTATTIETDTTTTSTMSTLLPFLLQLIQSLHVFGIGIGLYQCSSIHQTMAATVQQHTFTANELLLVLRVFARMYVTSAIVLVLSAMACVSDEYLYYYYGPALVLTAAILGAIVVCCMVDNGTTTTTTSTTTTAHDIRSNSKTNELATRCQQMGSIVLRNMALCIGALGIDALALVLDNVLQPDTAWYDTVYGVCTDAGQPIAVAVLLVTLRKQCHVMLSSPMVAGMKQKDNNAGTTTTTTTVLVASGTQVDLLYKAQEGFYNKISSVFSSAATTKLVTPWLLMAKTKLLASTLVMDWCNDHAGDDNHGKQSVMTKLTVWIRNMIGCGNDEA